MKYTKYILSLMFLASLNGCIDEDMSDCPGNCLLEFSYVGDGTTQIFQDKIHKVEHKLYPKAIELFRSGKLIITGRKVKIKY